MYISIFRIASFFYTIVVLRNNDSQCTGKPLAERLPKGAAA
jgi:hypothetical protein